MNGFYRWLGVDLFGQVVVGLGGNFDCRCGILYAPMLGGGVPELVSLTSPYSSELLVLGGGFVCLQGFAMCACAQAWRIWFYGSGFLVSSSVSWVSGSSLFESLQGHPFCPLSTIFVAVLLSTIQENAFDLHSLVESLTVATTGESLSLHCLLSTGRYLLVVSFVTSLESSLCKSVPTQNIRENDCIISHVQNMTALHSHVSLTLWRRNYFFFNFSTLCI